MPWPALVGPALSIASSLIGGRKRRRAAPAPPVSITPVAPPLPTLISRAVGAVARRALPGVPGRRRRRAGLTMREMEKISMMSAILGPRHPAVTFIVMRALGGRI